MMVLFLNNILGLVLKSKNKIIDKNMYDFSYCEPKYHYECDYCQSKPWFSF